MMSNICVLVSSAAMKSPMAVTISDLSIRSLSFTSYSSRRESSRSPLVHVSDRDGHRKGVHVRPVVGLDCHHVCVVGVRVCRILVVGGTPKGEYPASADVEVARIVSRE